MRIVADKGKRERKREGKKTNETDKDIEREGREETNGRTNPKQKGEITSYMTHGGKKEVG